MAPVYQLETTVEKAEALRRLGFKLEESVADLDKRNWVVVPEGFAGSRKSFAVNPARLAYGPAVEKVGMELGLNYKNTARDALGRPFVGDLCWEDAIKLNLFLGGRTLTLAEFKIYGRLLYSGMAGEEKVYDFSGKEIPAEALESYFKDVYAKKSPERGEWLDARIFQQNRRLYLKSNHLCNKRDELFPQTTRALSKSTLMKRSEIALEEWLMSSAGQGFPDKNLGKGNLVYWDIKNNGFMAFSAATFGVNLACRNPGSCREQGVRTKMDLE